MESLFIFMVLVMISMAYNYDNDIDYRPRYGLYTRSRTQFARTTFGPPPFRRPSFRNRFHPRLYSGKYLRERSANPSLSPWLRTNNSEITDAPTVIPKNPNASLSIFGVLTMKQINATLVTDKTKYPWIARVVATPEDSAPVVCTAACMDERIFVTAATCLVKTKVFYTRVHYQDVALQPLAFVLPSKPTKAMFHDLGLIVVNRNFTKPWKIATTYFKKHSDWVPAYEDTFLWMTRYLNGRWNTWTVGYVGEDSEKEYQPNRPNNTVYSLYELQTTSDPFLCNYVYNQHQPSDKFFVPCYSACSLTEYNKNLTKCYKYLAGEGHLVVADFGYIFGVATWGGHQKKGLNKPPLPVGYATANSFAFEKDLECARNITKAPETSETFDIFCQ